MGLITIPNQMKAKQLEFGTWGGRRKGAGRKVAPGKVPGVSHKKRPLHKGRFPIHAVWRARDDAPRLRRRDVMEAIRRALREGGAQPHFRVVHYSIQGNHIHLVVEAPDEVALSRGMQSLAVRIARAVNRAASRKGSVFADHYFARELKTPAEVRRAIRYVLDNFILHLRADPQTDPCAGSLAEPRTWLLDVGWKRSRAGPLPVAWWPTFANR